MSDELILVQNLIHEIRGKKVILDFDLAKLYHVKTGELNQAVKRNSKRFPPDFMFQLTPEEVKSMMSQFVISSNRKVSAPPFVFTQEGIAMLSGVLKSDIAIQANISIMRAFVQVREYLLAASSISSELKELKSRVDLLEYQQEENLAAVNDLSEDVRKDIDSLYLAIGQIALRLEEKKKMPVRRIGFKRVDESEE